MKKLISLLVLFGSFSAFACNDTTICVGDRVNLDRDAGRADEVFNNGNVKIKLDDFEGYSYATTENIGKRVHCYDNVCTNDRINLDRDAGRAVEVFNNGNVKLKLDGYEGYYYATTKTIGVGFRCSDKLCVGDRVNFDIDVGTVKEIFSNGNVRIKLDGYEGFTYKTTSELGYALNCHN